MVVAQLGLSMGMVTKTIYGVSVFMAITTTLIAPLLAKWAFRSTGADDEIYQNLTDPE